jgi:hypothetical protein
LKLPYGGAAPISKPTPPKPTPKKQNTAGFVTAIQDTSATLCGDFEMHKDSWVGAINFSEEFVKQFCQMFQCIQCHLNDHTLPSCPFMKNWSIKKKPCTDQNSVQKSRSLSVGGVNSVLASDESTDPMTSTELILTS